MIIGVLLVPWLDGFAKLLIQRLPVLEVVWGRFLMQFFITLPFAWFHHGPRLFAVRQLELQILRSTFLVIATIFFFAALRTMSVANAIAVFFIHPLLTVVIASKLLGESVGWHRWLAAGLGFTGALVVIRPGFESFHWNSLFALGTGFCFSGYVLLGRRLAKECSPLQALLVTGLIGTVIMSMMQPAIWQTPLGKEWLWMVAMGSFGLVGHYFIIKALQHASASKLAALGYFEIIGSVLVGYIFFSNLPDHWTWLGITVIVSSGLYVMRHSICGEES